MKNGPERPEFIVRDRVAARQRLLLVTPHASYRAAPFIQAARRRGVEVFLLSGRSAASLPSDTPGATFDVEEVDHLDELVTGIHDRFPFTGICATDDSIVAAAAKIARVLGLVFNDPVAASLTRNKLMARRRMAESGLNCPAFVHLDARLPAVSGSEIPQFPLVIKPLSLSASRGVIRVDTMEELNQALVRIRTLLKRESLQPDYTLIAERYIPGFEVAVEGLLSGGILKILAVFDKPEPMCGPYFEETFYTTPSRLGDANLAMLGETVERMCSALGLREGPIHAECRVNERGVWPLEIASRTIGGKCARLLTLATGLTLEDIVVAHALGEQPPIRPAEGGAGVLMVPVPATGVVRRVEGIGAARRIPGIEEVEIDVAAGQVVTAWPEGGSYPGFLFSRGATAHDAELALRRAYAEIRIVVAPLIAG